LVAVGAERVFSMSVCLVSRSSIESHQGSAVWPLGEIGCSCEARLLRGVSFARASAGYVGSSYRAMVAALIGRYGYRVDYLGRCRD
jgi:hypothetical protein